jgi:hypothetical protein
VLNKDPLSVTKATNVKSSIKLPPPPATLELDSATFDKVVLDEDKDVLVGQSDPHFPMLIWLTCAYPLKLSLQVGGK